MNRTTLVLLVAALGLLCCACEAAEETAQAAELGAGPNSAAASTSVAVAPAANDPAPVATPSTTPTAPSRAAAEPLPDKHFDPTFEVIIDGRKPNTVPFALPAPWVHPGEPAQPTPPARYAEVHEPRRDPLDFDTVDGKLMIILRPGDVMLESKDQGESWTPVVPDMPVVELVPGKPYYWGLTDIDRWGLANRVARSKDQGRIWELRLTGEHLDPLPNLLRRDDRHLVFATGEHLLWSRNARDWSFIQPKVHATVTALWTGDPQSTGKHRQWWVGGSNGTISHRNAKGEWIAETVTCPGTPPVVHGFARAGEGGTVFAATESGVFSRTESGWGRVAPLGARTYHDIRFVDENVGVAFGAAGEFAATIDGGITWTRHTAQSLDALGVNPDSATDVLDVNWRFVEPVDGGLVLVGDDMVVVKVESPYLSAP